MLLPQTLLLEAELGAPFFPVKSVGCFGVPLGCGPMLRATLTSALLISAVAVDELTKAESTKRLLQLRESGATAKTAEFSDPGE